MKTKIKIILLFLVILVSMLLLTGCSTKSTNEISIPQIRSDTYVYDEGDILDENTTETLNKLFIELESKTEVEFVVITVTDLKGYSIEEYANKLGNALGIGKSNEDNGMLLLISKSDKRVRLEVGRRLEGILNDAKCGRILDQHFVPYRDKDQYNQAALATTQATINIIAADKEVTIDGTDTQLTVEDEKPIPSWGWVIIVIAFIIIVIIMTIFDDSSTGGYTSGRSSGSSGRSGGGFGGGRFGGGGASR